MADPGPATLSDRTFDPPLTLRATSELWTLATPFNISREAMTEAPLVVVEVSDGTHVGRGESCPAPHFGEDVTSVLQQLDTLDGVWRLEADLGAALPAGSARNALDCALWDLRAKRAGRRIWDLLGGASPTPLDTVFTIGLASPGEMAEAARTSPHTILKLKLGAEGDLERLAAIRAAAPDKRLIADVNEGWSAATLAEAMPVLARHRVEMIEQPLPVAQDGDLAHIDHLVAVGADEACHTVADLDRIAPLYDAVNIKLDKTGGLTEALRLLEAATGRGLRPMIGCMLGTSLAMAPAFMVGQAAEWIDLDAPLLMGRDRPDGLLYREGRVHPPSKALWG